MQLPPRWPRHVHVQLLGQRPQVYHPQASESTQSCVLQNAPLAAALPQHNSPAELPGQSFGEKACWRQNLGRDSLKLRPVCNAEPLRLVWRHGPAIFEVGGPLPKARACRFRQEAESGSSTAARRPPTGRCGAARTAEPCC